MADQGVDADSIREAVDLFYERVLADPALTDASPSRLPASGCTSGFLLQPGRPRSTPGAT